MERAVCSNLETQPENNRTLAMVYPEQGGDDALKQAQKDAALAKAKAERMEAEKQIAEGERAIQQARRNRMVERREGTAAQLDELKSLTALTETPATPITLPSGGLTVGEGVVFPQIADSANQQLRQLIQQWLKDYETFFQSPSQLIIYQEQDARSVHQYRMVLDEIQALQKAAESFLQRTRQIARRASAWLENQTLAESQSLGIGLIAVPALANGIVKSVADLVQLFKKEVDLRNQPSLLDEEDAVALVQKEASKAGLMLEVYYPKVYPVYKTEATSSVLTEQWNALIQVLQLSSQAAASVPTLLEKLQAWADTDEKRFRQQQLRQEWEDLQAAFTVFEKTHTQLENQQENTSILQPLEQLSQLLMNPSAYHLRLQVRSQGAYQITRRLWRNALIEYHASVELNYMLFKSTGELIGSDKLSSRASFT